MKKQERKRRDISQISCWYFSGFSLQNKFTHRLNELYVSFDSFLCIPVVSLYFTFFLSFFLPCFPVLHVVSQYSTFFFPCISRCFMYFTSVPCISLFPVFQVGSLYFTFFLYIPRCFHVFHVVSLYFTLVPWEIPLSC